MQTLRNTEESCESNSLNFHVFTTKVHIGGFCRISLERRHFESSSEIDPLFTWRGSCEKQWFVELFLEVGRSESQTTNLENTKNQRMDQISAVLATFYSKSGQNESSHSPLSRTASIKDDRHVPAELQPEMSLGAPRATGRGAADEPRRTKVINQSIKVVDAYLVRISTMPSPFRS